MKQTVLIIAALFTLNAAMAQCRGFVKNNCGEAMGEYIPGENFNSASLFAGDRAEIKMTFNSGIDYRLVLCSHEILKDVEFVVSDADGTVFFDNTEQEMTDHFDFRVEGTRELTVKVKVPEQPHAKITPKGCVALIVGRKMEEGQEEVYDRLSTQ